MKNGKHTKNYKIFDIYISDYNNNKSIVPDEMIMKYFKSN